MPRIVHPQLKARAVEWANTNETPMLLYTPHAAPMAMAFYGGTMFPAEYRGGRSQ